MITNNPRKWAEESLTPARRRAFMTALAKLESERFSREYREAHNAINTAMMDNERALRRDLDDVWEHWSAQDKALEEQRQLADERDSKIQEFRSASGFYESEDLKALQEKASAIWKRDTDIFTPKVWALMDRYHQAQEASA
jgi:hypothetical protein